jgi:hypothetical protein
MPSENWLSTLELVADSSGPAGLTLNAATFLPLSLARIQRRVLSSVQRRDPHKQLEEARAIHSSYAMGWDFQVSDADVPLLACMEALGDPGSMAVVPGGHTCEVRTSTSARRYHATARGTDGTTQALESGILTDLQLSIERRSLLRVATTWEFWRMLDSAPDLSPANFSQTGYANPADTVVRIGGIEAVVFAGSLAFGREARPAGFTEDGEATAWEGSLVPDMVGRLVMRLDSDDFMDAFEGTVNTSLEIEIPTPGKTLTISAPKCALQIPDKRAVGPELYEHIVEFVAQKAPSSPLFTLSLA